MSRKSGRKSPKAHPPVAPATPAAAMPPPPANGKQQETPWRAIVLTAVLTACTTSLGVYLTGHYQWRQWRNEATYSIQTDLLSRRLGLVERFMRVSLRKSELASLYALRQQDLKEMQEAISRQDVAKAMLLMRQNSEDDHRFDELNSEYLTVMHMSVELFGPKTQDAVAVILKNHNPKVWETSAEERSNVIDAMSGEVLLNLADVPADTKITAAIGPIGSTRTEAKESGSLPAGNN